MTVPDHSFADWMYDVSKQVGSFTITGLIAFAVAKRSKAWTTVSRVQWRTVAAVITAASAIISVVVTIARIIGHF
jgi:hypothetical protein